MSWNDYQSKLKSGNYAEALRYAIAFMRNSRGGVAIKFMYDEFLISKSFPKALKERLKEIDSTEDKDIDYLNEILENICKIAHKKNSGNACNNKVEYLRLEFLLLCYKAALKKNHKQDNSHDGPLITAINTAENKWKEIFNEFYKSENSSHGTKVNITGQNEEEATKYMMDYLLGDYEGDDEIERSRSVYGMFYCKITNTGGRIFEFNADLVPGSGKLYINANQTLIAKYDKDFLEAVKNAYEKAKEDYLSLSKAGEDKEREEMESPDKWDICWGVKKCEEIGDIIIDLKGPSVGLAFYVLFRSLLEDTALEVTANKTKCCLTGEVWLNSNKVHSVGKVYEKVLNAIKNGYEPIIIPILQEKDAQDAANKEKKHHLMSDKIFPVDNLDDAYLRATGVRGIIDRYLTTVLNETVSFELSLQKASNIKTIDSYFDRLFIPVSLFEFGDKSKGLIPFKEAIEKYPKRPKRMILIAPPGSGKTSHLYYLIRGLAKDGSKLIESGKSIEDVQIPVYIGCHLIKRDINKSFGDIIMDTIQDKCEELVSINKKQLNIQLPKLMEDGKISVFIDGLDVFHTPENWDKIKKGIRQFSLGRFKKCHIYITSRMSNYPGNPFTGGELVSEFILAGFRKNEINMFVTKWFQISGNPVRGVKLLSKFKSIPRLMAISSNPLMLTMICKICSEGENILTNRASKASIYKKCLNLLIDEWKKREKMFPFTKLTKPDIDSITSPVSSQIDKIVKTHSKISSLKNDLNQIILILNNRLESISKIKKLNKKQEVCILQKLAYKIHENIEDTGCITEEQILKYLDEIRTTCNIPPDTTSKDILIQLTYRHGILIKTQTDNLTGYSFIHEGFLEYLTSAELLEQERWVDIAWENRSNPRWEEPIRMVMGLAKPNEADKFLEELIESNKKDSILQRPLMFACRCISDGKMGLQNKDSSILIIKEIIEMFKKQSPIHFLSPIVMDTISLLGQSVDDVKKEVIKSSSKKGRRHLRMKSIKAMGKIGYDPDIIEILKDVVKQEKEEVSEIRISAINSMAMIGSVETIDDLVKVVLNDKNQRIRWRASSALALIDPDKAVTKIINKADNDTKNNIEKVLLALTSIISPEFVSDYLEKTDSEERFEFLPGKISDNNISSFLKMLANRRKIALLSQQEKIGFEEAFSIFKDIAMDKSENSKDKEIRKFALKVISGVIRDKQPDEQRQIFDLQIEQKEDIDQSEEEQQKQSNSSESPKTDNFLIKILKVLKDENDESEIRALAAEAISLIKFDSFIDIFIESLRYSNNILKSTISKILIEKGSKQVVEDLQVIENLAKVIDGTYPGGFIFPPESKKQAVLILGEIGNEKATDKLMEIFKEQNNAEYIRAESATALGKISVTDNNVVAKVIKVLLKAVDDQSPDIRINAVRSLGEIRTTKLKVINKLILIIKHEESWICIPAIDSLGRIYNVIKDNDKRNEINNDTRNKINNVLISKLDELKYKKYPDMQAQLIQTLVDMGKLPKVLNRIIGILKEKDSDKLLRKNALKLLGEYGGEENIDLLYQALSDDDRKIRAAASESLGKLSRKPIPE